MLLDLGRGVARDYGVAFRFPEYLRKLYEQDMRIDLGRFNGDEAWELPIPATFVIDRQGTVVYASADPDYTVRPEPSEVIAAIP